MEKPKEMIQAWKEEISWNLRIQKKVFWRPTFCVMCVLFRNLAEFVQSYSLGAVDLAVLAVEEGAWTLLEVKKLRQRMAE